MLQNFTINKVIGLNRKIGDSGATEFFSIRALQMLPKVILKLHWNKVFSF